MNRSLQILMASLAMAASWFAMQAVHELGHVAGALLTGGKIEKVVLFPLTISSTSVAPNPQPGIVVWLGPIVGVLLPLAIMLATPRDSVLRKLTIFFAGFCLVTNGAYIGIGSFDAIGDCKQMLETGTPIWVMAAFGLLSTATGLILWHRLGSIQQFFANADSVNKRVLIGLSIGLLVLLAVEFLFSPR